MSFGQTIHFSDAPQQNNEQFRSLLEHSHLQSDQDIHFLLDRPRFGHNAS